MNILRPFILFASVTSLVGLGPVGAETGAWYAGDLHVHTTYSHDSWDPIADDEESEFYTLGHSVESQFAIAASRGLDYLAITDHNDIRAHDDPGFDSMGVLGVHAYENSLGGHAQMIGARSCYGPDGPFAGVKDCNGWPDRTPERITMMADRLRADGGAFQINHPSSDLDDPEHYRDWPYEHQIVPDTVEVWNIQSFWQPPAFSSNSIDDAIVFWEGFLNAGHRVGATGGSDNHWVSTTAVQGVGQPTTWIFATERTEEALLAGIRAGRTTISWQPPAYGGTRIFLEADGDGDGSYEAMVGDEVAAASSYRVRVENLVPGAEVKVSFSDDIAPMVMPALPEVEFTAPAEARWVRAEVLVPDHTLTPVGPACDEPLGEQTTYCRNRLVRVALSSPIYVA